MSFNSAPILVISFLVLALGCLCCCSSNSYRSRVRLFIWNVSIFLGRPVSLWISPSGLPLLCPIGFGLLWVHFHLFPESFWFLFWPHSLLIHCLITCYSISMFFSVLAFFPWGLFLVSVPCDQRKCLIWFQFSWTCWGLFCVLSWGLSLKMFHVHLKRMCILLLWDERLSIYIS